MIFHLLFGALAMWTVLFLIDYAKQSQLDLNWWQITLMTLCVVYWVFVIEVVYTFLAEGAPRAALINGLLTGFVAVIWAVLVYRFFLTKPQTAAN